MPDDFTRPFVEFDYKCQFDYGGKVTFPKEWPLDQCLQWVKNSTDEDWEPLWKFDGLSLDTDKGDRFCADKTGRLGYREVLFGLLVDEPTRRKFDIEGSLC